MIEWKNGRSWYKLLILNAQFYLEQGHNFRDKLEHQERSPLRIFKPKIK
ncbi:unnamed protein product [Moneuplotes crassus]|uniref:Uncharacterized protein n=1 Tax=Euplotes crassus TaxID=5936 RepID=A0AAD1XIB9_EUPCR|nr:unnamed protein product [Moneuplotes crassus]